MSEYSTVAPETGVNAMRSALGLAAVGLLGAAAWTGLCLAQPFMVMEPPGSPQKWVQLNGADDLERLRATNLNHYLRAQKIMAAANEICQPGAAQPSPTRFNANAVSCQSMFWLTSLPPKKQLSFQLDDVGYFALVSVTVVGNKFIDGPAHGIAIQQSGPNH
jgi:hypothetical protein